ncbi:MAG: DUF58 domain-containing protein [Desulfocapsaceae bacterium]|jgi:uncharacterized protein (DUF58 family)|nr:DUF58 domain-containing protein [Desulfocapsaceae bacterium]
MSQQKTREILKKVRQIEVRTNRLVTDSLAGSYHSVFKGRGMNFDEVREYVAGDEIRTIDWNVTARTGIPHVKKFTEERELTILLMIDISASNSFGSGQCSKREMMAELGSVLAFSAVRNNDKVGLILFTDFIEHYIPPAKGRSHILRVIRDILYFEPKGSKTDLAIPLEFVSKVTKRKAVIFLISDFFFSGDQDAQLSRLQPTLKVCNRHHDLISVIISDPREHQLPDCGRITIEDAETGQQLELDTSDPAIRRGWSELADQWRQKLQRALGTAGIDSLSLSTDRSYLTPLLSFFGARKRRHAR